MISTEEFEHFVTELGYADVSIGAEVEISNAVEIIWEYIDEHRTEFCGTVKLKDAYNQIQKIQEFIRE